MQLEARWKMRISAETHLLSDGMTLTESLAEQAHRLPLRPALTFLVDGSSLENTATYADLLTVSMRMAVGLREELRPGDRVLLLLPPGLEFVQVFLACLHARVIAGSGIRRFCGRASAHRGNRFRCDPRADRMLARVRLDGR